MGIDPELEAAIEARARAERERDGDAFARLTTDNFMLITRDGNVMDKAARTAEVREGQPRLKALPAGERIRVFGSSAAIRTRLAHTPEGTQVRFTTVWVKEDGQWKVASTQVTPVRD